MHAGNDTIVAIATAAGAGGVGIVRLSGPRAKAIGEALAGRRLRPRHAHHACFTDAAGDIQAARAARRSLDGVFSHRVEALMDAVLAIRVHVEAAIDFADEPLDTLGGKALREKLDLVIEHVKGLQREAERGRKLRDGLHVVLVGPPNAGKSSLLNALAGSERAIVTDVAGTTRDLLRESIRIDGVELTLVDTAGLREAGDAIEAEGIRRARGELERADLALVVLDARAPDAGRAAVAADLAGVPHVLWLHNKADLLPSPPRAGDADRIAISARTGLGLDELHRRLLALSAAGDAGEGAFSARARHVQALARTAEQLAGARAELGFERLELAAEALAQAHSALGEIGGRLSADGLLGHIFGSFCIGK